MTEKDDLPEEIRKKLLEKRADSDAGSIDEIDLDEVAGGAYSGINRTVAAESVTGLGRGKLKR